MASISLLFTGRETQETKLLAQGNVLTDAAGTRTWLFFFFFQLGKYDNTFTGGLENIEQSYI